MTRARWWPFTPDASLDLSAPSPLLAVVSLDRFEEVVPDAEQALGAAFGFNAPKARAQQAILLAVPPDPAAELDHGTLVAVLAETRELARARMARPVDLDEQFWGLAPTGSGAGDWRGLRLPRARQMIFDVLLRIEAEPYQRDPARGWAAELADPVWFLGRQWQLGEHQGEDASSPVGIDLTVGTVPVRPAASQPGLDPATVPAQAVIESEPGDWWTVGRRVRTGRAVAAAAAAHGVTLPADGIALAGLPVPYDSIHRAGRPAAVATPGRTQPRRELVRDACPAGRRTG